MRSLKWFQIGLRFKKWLISGVLGLILLIASLVVLLVNVDIIIAMGYIFNPSHRYLRFFDFFRKYL